MRLANVAGAVKSENAMKLFGQMYGEHRAKANAASKADAKIAKYQKQIEYWKKKQAIIPITTMEKFWQEVYIWTVWQQPLPMEHAKSH